MEYDVFGFFVIIKEDRLVEARGHKRATVNAWLYVRFQLGGVKIFIFSFLQVMRHNAALSSATLYALLRVFSEKQGKCGIQKAKKKVNVTLATYVTNMQRD